jgi:hypothetical protein
MTLNKTELGFADRGRSNTTQSPADTNNQVI